MVEFEREKWDWDDTKVHPAVRYPSTRISTDVSIDAVVGMIESFNYTKRTPHARNHSLNEDNQGLRSLPIEYDLEITCKPFGSGYQILTSCQDGDRYFDVILQPLANYEINLENDDGVGIPKSAWRSPLNPYLVFEGCKINEVSERYSYTDTPTVTFTCIATRCNHKIKDVLRSFGDGVMGSSLSDSALDLS